MKNEHFDNDNEELSFITLSAATKNVTRYLGFNEEKNEESNGDKNTRDTPDKRANESAADIERRIRDILAMENRLRRKTI